MDSNTEAVKQKAPKPVRAGSVGRLSRLGVGLQVAITIVLAVAAVMLVNWLVGRPGIRQRFDMTSTGKNTLATATEGLLGRMEDEVLIEILYRPEAGPRMSYEAEVMQRTEKLLAMIETEAGGKVKVEVIDISDVAGWQKRQQELRLQGFENGLVVSNGDRRVFLRLDGDLAQFQTFRVEAGVPVAPKILAYNAEESIAEGILDVTAREALHAYFTFGYGEQDALDLEQNDGMGVLTSGLERDGVVVHRWNMVEDGPLPDNCEVLVAIGPETPWPDEMYAAILDYADRGGRLIVAPALSPEHVRASNIPDLLDHFGLEVSEGRVAHRVADPRTGRMVEGIDRCELHQLAPSALPNHPILKPFAQAGRGLVIPLAHQIRVVRQPENGGVAQTLLESEPQSWIDAVPIDRVYRRDVDGSLKAHPIAATVQRPPVADVTAPLGLEAVLETRVVALGSEVALSNIVCTENRNSGFARAMFNWATDQEHRIVVPARDPDLRFLPRTADGRAFVVASQVAQFWLPGFVFLTGLIVWFLRSRGSGRRTPTPRDPRAGTQAPSSARP